MSQTRVYLATAPNGDVLKRTTRTKFYTLCVVGRHSYDKDVAAAHEIANWGANPRSIDNFKGAKTADEYVALLLKEDLANIEARKAKGYYDRFMLLTCMETDKYLRRRLSQYSHWCVDLQPVPMTLKS